MKDMAPIFSGITLFIVVCGYWIWQGYKDAIRRKEALRRHQALSERTQILLNQLNATKEDEIVLNELSAIANFDAILSHQIYQESLNAVERSNRSTRLKRFALETGRISLGHNRDDGQPTIYDEQAIRNDISARTDSM